MSRQKRKSPKIRLSGKKVFFTFFLIVIICIVLLVITILAVPNNNTVIQKNSDQNVIQNNEYELSSNKKKENNLKNKSDVLEKVSEKSSRKPLEIGKTSKKNVEENLPEKKSSATAVSKLSYDRSYTQDTIKKISPKNDIPFEIPDAKNGAQLVFIFDDAGNNVYQLQKYLKLPFAVSIAVLPGLPDSLKCADEIRAAGKELLLHQPMQAIDQTIKPGPEAVTPDMKPYEIKKLILHNIAEIGPVAGMNNHEGSLICENEDLIGAVMEAAVSQGIYFLDSRTTAQTQIPKVAAQKQIAYYQRDIFLDNPETKVHILEEIRNGINTTAKKKAVIMIGHVWAADLLPELLEDLYPVLKAKGYVFCTVSQSDALIKP